MQGGQLIDSGHARVPCDLCCAQASALAMPACKWANGVCMSCAWSVGMHGYLCRPISAAPREGGWCRRKAQVPMRSRVRVLDVCEGCIRKARGCGLGAPPQGHSRVLE